MNEEKLHSLVGQFLQDLGGALSIPLVGIGDSLGLYKKLATEGPFTPASLASATGLNERYLREWLSAQASSNYISFDAKNNSFFMTEEQAAILANENSPFFLAPAFEAAAAFNGNRPAVEKCFKTGEGFSWGKDNECVACATAKFFRPGYLNHIVQDWLPALDGVIGKLENGARVADIGCGHGLSTLFMAQAFPKSEFIGFDYHEGSIADARKHAAKHGMKNLSFEVGLAKEFPGSYDFITLFDCLHDMGDPVGAMKHIKQALKPDGTCMVIEPMAGNNLSDNLNPVSRLYFAASTMVCVPTSLSQEVGAALGAQAGEERIREVVVDGAGFKSLRRATETPFSMVLEARA